MNVLERNKSSCFNQNHLTTEIQSAGIGHSLKCSDLSVNENDNITWYKVIKKIKALAIDRTSIDRTSNCRKSELQRFLEPSKTR